MLAGYDFIGFDKKPLSFTDVDFDLVQRSEHRARVSSFFGRSPHRFRMHFHNAYWDKLYDPKEGPEEEFEAIERMWLLMGSLKNPHRPFKGWKEADYIGYFMPGIVPDPDAINVVYTGNATGKPKIVLTPHILAHRLGHLHNQYRYLYQPIIEHGAKILEGAYGYPADLEKVDLHCWLEYPDVVNARINAIMKAITTTRAGRASRVCSWDYTAEWMAQYVSTGSVQFPEIAPHTIDLVEIFHEDTKRGHCKNVATLEPMTAIKDYPLREFKEAIGVAMEKALTALKGQVFVT